MLTKKQLLNALQKLSSAKPKVIVIGDLILDEYLIGYPERISREAPVLILEYKENYYKLGGASNAAINAAFFGADITLIGTVGIDKAAEKMQEICEQNNIKFSPLILSDKPTTLKTRILSTNLSRSMVNNGNSSLQQVLRIDRQSRTDLSAELQKNLFEIIEKESLNSSAILLSDYNLGVLSKELSQKIINQYSKVIVDPSSDFERFKGAFLITPNEPDTEKEIGLFVHENNFQSVQKSLQNKLSEKTNFLITRGAAGMVLLEQNNIHTIAAFNKAEVFDVTGAGDTVAACVSVAVAAGLSLEEGMALGNLAASIVVRKSGSATTNFTEMKEALEKINC